jgi:hypothetical protein
MGFHERAKFNQPGRRAPLRGGDGAIVECGSGSNVCANRVGSEWNWQHVRQTGCGYCGDDRHSTIFCELLQLHGTNANVHCLSCHAMDHFLKDCEAPPTFDSEQPRSKKLMFYAHSAHWRKTLGRQHERFATSDAARIDLASTDPKPRSRTQSNSANDERPEAADEEISTDDATAASKMADADAMGDASVAFAALPCPSCGPETHWDGVEENVAMVGALCQRQTQDGCAEANRCRPHDEPGGADPGSRVARADANERGRTRSDSAATTGAMSKSACGSSSSGREPEATPEPRPFWSEPNWVLETRNCPVVWNVMHKDDPERCWAIFNPLGSVAVDAFWRTAMAAMGWDAPELPDGKGA